MSTLTSANSVLAIGVTGLYDVAQILQGFSEGDAYSIDTVDVAETMLGVDGILSAGWIPQRKVMNVTLQADSSSINFFESWYAAQEAAREVFTAFGNINQSSVDRNYTLIRGFLKNYAPIGDAKKILQPRKFQIEWNILVPVPV
jgi:hypothetical protein